MAEKVDYRLYKRSRKTKTGKSLTYWYVHLYDASGKRVSRATGETNRYAAELWAQQEYRSGRLIPGSTATFETYAVDWWVWDKCQYIRSQRGRVGRTHADTQRSYLKNHILPHFAPKKLTDISTKAIESWIVKLEDTTILSAASINHCIACLKVMMKEATRLGLIAHDPALSVRKLPTRRSRRELLTLAEVRDLFSEDKVDKYWHGRRMHRALNMVAAFTGARQGEIRAIRAPSIRIATVFPDKEQPYLHIENTMTRSYGLKKETKTGDIRDIPIPMELYEELRVMVIIHNSDPKAYLFSYGGQRPVDNKTIDDMLYRTLDRMGISREECRRRGITFHAWRHWLNTLLVSQNISDRKTRSLTGHTTEESTRRYTDFGVHDYSDVAAVQAAVFNTA